MTSEWLTLLQNASDNLDGDATHLERLAYTFRRVGNDKIANELQELSYNLSRTGTDIRNATHLKLTSDVKDAEAMTGAIFTSLVAVSEKKGTKAKS